MDVMVRTRMPGRGRLVGIAFVLTATLGAADTVAPAQANVTRPAAGAAAHAALPAPAFAAAGTSPGNQFLYGFNSGFDINAGSAPRPGRLVRLLAPSNTGKPDTWLLKPDGTIHLFSHPRLCLNLPGRSYSSLVDANLRDCNGSVRERFVVRKPSAHSPVLFIAAAGKRSMCLSAPGLYEQELISLGRSSWIDSEAWSDVDLKGMVSQVSAGVSASLTVARPAGPGSHVVYRAFTHNIRQYWLVGNDSTFDSLTAVTDVGLCLTVAGSEKLNASLAVDPCRQGSGDSFLGIIMGSARTAGGPVPYVITTADARFCLSASGGAGTGYAVQLRRCDASTQMLWSTTLKMVLNIFSLDYQYQRVSVASAAGPLSMTAPPSRAGGVVSLSAISKARWPFQIWTTVPPGAAGAGNSDGSTSLRPLFDVDLCLTAPAGYSANVPLRALPCTDAADQKLLLISGGPPKYPAEIVPFGDGQRCVGAAASDRAIVLNSCDYASDQSWGAFFILSSPIRVTDPAGTYALAVSNPGSGGGGAAIASLADLRTDQVWVQTQGTGGYTFRSAYDTAWCLDAPSYAAGTQLTVQPCDGSASQVFAVTVANGAEMINPASASTVCLSAGPPAAAGQPATLQACSTSDASEMWQIRGAGAGS